jgi:hypothetical protein
MKSMWRGAYVAAALLIGVGCDGDARTRPVPSARTGSTAARTEQTKPLAPPEQPSAASSQTQQPPPPPEPQIPSEPKVLQGHFRGKDRLSRVLFLDDMDIVHTWDDKGTERREPIATGYPPGHRECKALRSLGSQDFLLCMYWYTGPGGGRVDGVLYDIRRHILGEFFSAAINIQLLNTLCSPETMVGPMPSYNMVGWETTDATADSDAEVRVTVAKEGWTTTEARTLRSLPKMKKFCQCVGEDGCPGAPTPPTETSTVVYRLTKDQLHPTEASKPILGRIAEQWGHSPFLKAWNLRMRGF